MQLQRIRPVSGHVYRVTRKRGVQWYVKWRGPDGRQVQKRLGPEWPDSGPPAPGYFNKRTAEAALQEILTDARRGLFERSANSGVTFDGAAAEWLRHAEFEREVKPSTLREYRSIVSAHLLPAFDERPIEAITTREIERWRSRLIADGRLSRRTVNKLVTVLGGIMGRAERLWDLPGNPVRAVERHPERYSGDLDVLSPEEVHALCRATETPEDASIFLLAAFTGLRLGEILALRWGSVDFPAETIRVRASFTYGHVSTPKNGRVRSVPMIPTVAEDLDRLASRECLTTETDLVFPGLSGGYLDGSALRRRYKRALRRAGLRQLRFHDLRHTFGTLAVGALSLMEVKEAMGHADARTTQRYIHYKPRGDEARRLAAVLDASPILSPVEV